MENDEDLDSVDARVIFDRFDSYTENLEHEVKLLKAIIIAHGNWYEHRMKCPVCTMSCCDEGARLRSASNNSIMKEMP